MHPNDVQRIVQQAWTEQRWDDWRVRCADSYRFQLTPTIRLDLAQTLEWSLAWFTAFPDYREEVRSVYSSPDGVAYELSGQGTSSADLTLFGRALIPHAPGRHFTLEYAKVLVLDGDGMIVQDRQYLDTDSLRRQLDA
ncbi:ester cyclase [Arthrobacter sp. NPDC090010]|uniref:ester cyclase n=1 Tax=Arthrobacter sp. NPDC090010 TaxID=3363942 RepID=UPI0038187562